MGRLQRLIVRGVLNVVARPKLTLAIATVVLAACATWAYSALNISTDTNKLFSPKVGFFADYLAYEKKFPENEAVYVIVEPKDPANPPPVRRWTAAADAVAAKLRTLTAQVRAVDARVPIEQLGDQGLLFESPDKLKEAVDGVREFIPLMKLIGEKPNVLTSVIGPTPMDRLLSGLMVREPDAQTAEFVELVARSCAQTVDRAGGTPELPSLASLGASDPSRLGYYYVADETDKSRHLLLVRAFPKRTFDSLTAISEKVEAIRDAVKASAIDFPEFTFGVTGRPALEADEMRTSDRDSTRAEIVALIVVFVGLVLFLRSIWLAIAAEICLGFGIGWTFGWAELTVGELNLLSIVFLIALIGIGMDYLVQILVRYRQEATRHTRPLAIWTRIFTHVGPPINTACLGAAGAFLVAIFTDFRGAAELGIIAGGGLLLCLLSGYTVLPAILTLFPGHFAKTDDDEFTPLAGKPAGAGGWRLLMPVVWAVILVVGVLIFAPLTGFNPNLLQLQARKLESVKLVRKLQTFSLVVLSPDVELLRKTRSTVKDLPSVASTESIVQAYDNAEWLAANAKLPKIDWAEPTPVKPDDVSRLADKARALAKRFGDGKHQDAATALATFADRLTVPPERRAAVAERLTAWQSGFVEQLKVMLRQFNPGPPRPMELPQELRSHFVADDGTAALHIYPKDDLWRREALERFVREVETAVKTVPGAPTPTGIASNVYHTTGAIEESFYRAAAYAFGLIVLLVLIDLRNVWQTLVAISVLALGLPMLVSLMGLLRIDWNFANFFGLPILIGAGHEYGVFMVHRYREACRDPRRYWRRWDASDKALLLCAYVTCSSFGFFAIIANHRGLQSLGLVMTLGTACIYLATLLVVRPLLLWRLTKCYPLDRKLNAKTPRPPR